MSPDRRWLILRQFYAFETDFVVSEQYLLYDLSGDAASNRHGLTPYTSEIPGRAVYPASPGNLPGDPEDVPGSRTHRFRSSSFYWSQDSRFVAFADSVQGVFSVVLVSIASDKITAYVRPLLPANVCSGDPATVADTSNLTLIHAEIASVGSSPVIVAQFESANHLCAPKQLTPGLTDFKLADAEVWEHRKLKPATVIKRQ
jgi:hypothetical protein